MPRSAQAVRSSRAKLFEYTARRSDGSEVSGEATASGELELDRFLLAKHSEGDSRHNRAKKGRDRIHIVRYSTSSGSETEEIVRSGGHTHVMLAGNPHLATRVRKALPPHLKQKLVDVVPSAARDRVEDVVEKAQRMAAEAA